MSLQYLTEVCGPADDIFAEAAGNPKIAAKKAPTLEAVLTAVVKVVEKRSVEGAANLIREDLQDMYDMYTITNGDRPQPETAHDEPVIAAREAWDTGLDDRVEALFTPEYGNVLSNDWLANNTIDTRLNEEGGVDRLADAFGKEVYKQLCWQTGEAATGGGKMKSPAQILANAGITQSAVIGYFADRLSTEEGGNRSIDATIYADLAAPTETSEIDVVMDKVFEHVGIDYDVDGVRDELELVLDDDEVLSAGAAGRIGLVDVADIYAVQRFGLDRGAETLDVLSAMLLDRSLAAKDGPKATGKPSRKADAPKGDAIDPLVLSLLQQHSAVPAAKMAERIGVSRATYNNYVNGKTQLVPDNEQRATIRTQIEADLNGLQNALDLLGDD